MVGARDAAAASHLFVVPYAPRAPASPSPGAPDAVPGPGPPGGGGTVRRGAAHSARRLAGDRRLALRDAREGRVLGLEIRRSAHRLVVHLGVAAAVVDLVVFLGRADGIGVVAHGPAVPAIVAGAP